MLRENYKIIFYGTPEFAVESLEALHKAGFNIQAVVTVADKKAGRGRKIQQSPVKQYAIKYNLRLIQPQNLKSPDFMADLKKIQPDLQVVVAFRMLPDAVINAGKDGTINLHASLLPQYRGAAPINHAIMQGESLTGLTTFFIEPEIDTGAVINQAEVPIDADDTAGSLHDKLKVKGADLLVKTVDDIMQGATKAIPQKQLHKGELLKKAPKIFSQNCYVCFEQNVNKAYNFIRGLSPYPAARMMLKNRENQQTIECLLLKVRPVIEQHSIAPGSIVSDNKSYLKISAINGSIEILEIKAQGKRAMDIKSFLNGFAINSYTLE